MNARPLGRVGWPRHWNAPWVVVWRAPWWFVAQIFRVGLCACAFLGWGPREAERVWRDTA